jgi:hypothetical protein
MMSEKTKYCVMPKAPNYKSITLTTNEKDVIREHTVVGPALLILPWIIVFVISLVVFGIGGVLPGNVFLGSVIAATVVSVLIHLLTRTQAANQIRTKEVANDEQARKEEISRVNNEAKSMTFSLTHMYETSVKLSNELPFHLEQASIFLQNAEYEFNSNAYAPFWDAVEGAAQHLAALNDKAQQLSQNANSYYRSLQGQNHTFPAFPVQRHSIPDASAVLADLRRIVRQGQTNYEFANIWEHRRTREVLIAGFRTLGDAVNNLGGTIELAISNLQQSVSSDIANLVEQEIRTR